MTSETLYLPYEVINFTFPLLSSLHVSPFLLTHRERERQRKNSMTQERYDNDHVGDENPFSAPYDASREVCC
jgi:hypothetical protein